MSPSQPSCYFRHLCFLFVASAGIMGCTNGQSGPVDSGSATQIALEKEPPNHHEAEGSKKSESANDNNRETETSDNKPDDTLPSKEKQEATTEKESVRKDDSTDVSLLNGDSKEEHEQKYIDSSENPAYVVSAHSNKNIITVNNQEQTVESTNSQLNRSLVSQHTAEPFKPKDLQQNSDANENTEPCASTYIKQQDNSSDEEKQKNVDIAQKEPKECDQLPAKLAAVEAYKKMLVTEIKDVRTTSFETLKSYISFLRGDVQLEQSSSTEEFSLSILDPDSDPSIVDVTYGIEANLELIKQRKKKDPFLAIFAVKNIGFVADHALSLFVEPAQDSEDNAMFYFNPKGGDFSNENRDCYVVTEKKCSGKQFCEKIEHAIAKPLSTNGDGFVVVPESEGIQSNKTKLQTDFNGSMFKAIANIASAIAKAIAEAKVKAISEATSKAINNDCVRWNTWFAKRMLIDYKNEPDKITKFKTALADKNMPSKDEMRGELIGALENACEKIKTGIQNNKVEVVVVDDTSTEDLPLYDNSKKNRLS